MTAVDQAAVGRLERLQGRGSRTIEWGRVVKQSRWLVSKLPRFSSPVPGPCQGRNRCWRKGGSELGALEALDQGKLQPGAAGLARRKYSRPGSLGFVGLLERESCSNGERTGTKRSLRRIQGNYKL